MDKCMKKIIILSTKKLKEWIIKNKPKVNAEKQQIWLFGLILIPIITITYNLLLYAHEIGYASYFNYSLNYVTITISNVFSSIFSIYISLFAFISIIFIIQLILTPLLWYIKKNSRLLKEIFEIFLFFY